MTATNNYRLIKENVDYVILDEGFDWFLVKIKGQTFYDFKWVF